MMTKTDKLIFCGVLLSALLVFVMSNIAFSTNGQRVAVIEQKGNNVATYNLETLTQEKQLRIETDNGVHELLISKNGVAVQKTNCKEQTCKAHIEKAGQTIVCLPYQLVIRIEGQGEVDGIAY